jgi:hypothetical protein
MEVDVPGSIHEGLLEGKTTEVKSGAGQYFTPRPLTDAIPATKASGRGANITFSLWIYCRLSISARQRTPRYFGG